MCQQMIKFLVPKRDKELLELGFKLTLKQDVGETATII